ncbi:hypothetical protein [Arenibacter latericius]|uniref:hypothetical protein n=1 Tax=Arenibacter latericius TaxID=86104 RepID=UPI0003FDC75A|nr:hypothetical protein [Arenibacter latericius]MDX1363369.1 hypothetical protein [Arenibacter latericius]
MDIYININEKSNDMDLKMEDHTDNTNFVPDAGAPPADLGISENDDSDQMDDATSSADENFDIGGPAEWLVQVMANASDNEEENEDLTDTDTDNFNDGGSGPTE